MSEGIGVSVRRKEDKKFLTGKGRYTDDISRPGQVHAFFVRSDVAHANIKSINKSKRCIINSNKNDFDAFNYRTRF